MDSTQFNELVTTVKIGKLVGNSRYIHISALKSLELKLKDFIYFIANALKIPEDHWNIIKLHDQQFKLSYLHYPNFYEDAYPALHTSITVDLENKTRKDASYSESENVPILHRKELMILPENEYFDDFVAITQEGEAAGLYENSRIIGFKKSWERIIKEHGYELVDGRLFRASALLNSKKTTAEKIDRHKTAIQRQGLSAPMKSLAKHNYLNGDYTVFDYGCGLGDDLRELEAHGIDATGWDPNHRPEIDRFPCDLVNLGFVINVIEDREERIVALQLAFDLAKKLLVASAMIAGKAHIKKFKPYKDGVITSLNTFQKYYSQSELQAFIENCLDENAIAVGPGIFYVFKDKLEEQVFLSDRQKRHHNWKQIATRPISNQEKFEILYANNKELLKDFWNACLILGRIPANDEFQESNKIKSIIGSNKKAFSVLNTLFENNEFELAQRYRKEDLLVFFALSLFKKRKPYIRLPEQLQRDVKVFFGNYNNAIETCRELLFSISDTEQITDTCISAHQELPASSMAENHSLTFHKDFIDLLPPLLRVYVGCGIQLYGELDDIQLIKIHFHSGKVSFMGYENFNDSPLPILKERIKINLGQQTVDFFDYVDEFSPHLLYFKSHYITGDYPNYKKQYSFDQKIKMFLPINSYYGIKLKQLNDILGNNQLEIKGFRLYNKKQ